MSVQKSIMRSDRIACLKRDLKRVEAENTELKELLKHKGYLDEVWKRNELIKKMQEALEELVDQLENRGTSVSGTPFGGEKEVRLVQAKSVYSRMVG